jgi:hypothetical protein
MRRTTGWLAAVLAVVALVVPAQSRAQDMKGRWGAEVNSDLVGSLLKFRSSSSAWLLDAFFTYDRRDSDDANFDDTFVSASGSLGMRFYRRVTEKTRPFTSVSAVLVYTENGASTAWRPGAQLEFGASHFFNPNVSLGMSAALAALYSRSETDIGFTRIDVTQTTIQFSGIRVTGGVYF